MRAPLLAVAALFAFLVSGCFVVVEEERRSPPPPSDPVYQATYEWCDFDSDCEPSDDCVSITITNPEGFTVSDGMCTHACADDADCPLSNAGYAGACYEVGGASALCYERCELDSDCTIGFGCYPTSGVPDAICLPR
jgi:hypothetical protein